MYNIYGNDRAFWQFGNVMPEKLIALFVRKCRKEITAWN